MAARSARSEASMPLAPAPLLAQSFNELWPILRARGFWAGLFALGIVLGIAGPYGTAATLPLEWRLCYWLSITLATGTCGFVLGFVGCDLLHAMGLPKLIAGPLAGAITGLPVSGIVLSINAVFLAAGDLAMSGVPLVLSIIAVSAVISLATTVTFFLTPAAPQVPRAAGMTPDHPHADPTPPDPTPPNAHQPDPNQPRLLARLPAHLRGPLIALTATDHYTEVTTAHGTTRLLLRLSDAIAETVPTPGLRIHRSHWVALDQIIGARRDGPRAIVTLSDRRDRPASRRSLPQLEEAGFLMPR
ncbi:LytTR family DNA-binding domain-containing protein [Paragemmobacter ruber]|uniref:HTH LytTR-type domain-containing protein n=1 Tax=Paragemmobacter ruber TaxID=1985673 RepID=A0ABW9Y6D2_9RHOB|nr:LytTR family DNA-binding domain-containing protein [Rhodobacter ruber]NBE08132.1 hypothetical protein [Rhodobacter ruber]